MTQRTLGTTNRALLWVAVSLVILGAVGVVIGVAIKPSSFVYLILLVPAIAMVAWGIARLRADRWR